MKLIRLSLILLFVTVLGIFSISSTSYADAAYDIPDWIENLAGLWFSGSIDDDTFGTALDWLIDNAILTTPSSSSISYAVPIGGNGTHTIFPIGGNGTHSIIPNSLVGVSIFTNSTGTYMQTPSGTYMIYQ